LQTQGDKGACDNSRTQSSEPGTSHDCVVLHPAIQADNGTFPQVSNDGNWVTVTYELGVLGRRGNGS
jgi:hypothetical protein